jgi:hypothetical protein
MSQSVTNALRGREPHHTNFVVNTGRPSGPVGPPTQSSYQGLRPTAGREPDVEPGHLIRNLIPNPFGRGSERSHG